MSEARRNLLVPDAERWPEDQPVIELEGVSKRFGDEVVLEDLSLSIPTGQTTVIVGQSGSGKSVLLRLMNGLTLPDEGSVKLFGVDITQASERERIELRKRCTMVFQSYALIDSLNVLDNIGFPLRENTRMNSRTIRQKVDELLEIFELSHARYLLPSELSGGMKKRVSLARAVISNPEVVLFDEPTTGLDPIMIAFVDDMIIRTREQFAITSVIISHDMPSNRRLADKMSFLAGGRIVAEGSFQEVLHSPLPEVRAVMDSARTEGLTRKEEGRVDVVDTEAAAPKAPEPIVRVRGLHRWFGDNHVLRGVDLDVPERKKTVIIGGSGSGKSVLVKHIIGLFKPDEGEITVFGQRLAELDERGLQAMRARIGLLFQNAALFDSMSVADNIGFPLKERERLRSKEIYERVAEVAEKLKIPDALPRFPSEISIGERKRVGLARAIITRPEIMIYDEPTTGQDPIMMSRVDEMILEAAEQFDITSIVISHDMVSTFRIADQIAMVYQGELAITGPPEALLASKDERVQRFIFAGEDEV